MQSSFPREFTSLAQVFAFVDKALGELRVSPEGAYAAQLAVEELFTNIVKYGQPTSDEVTISLKRDSGRLVVELTDRGDIPFDPTAAPEVDTSLKLEERKVGGLGIHLIRNLMDEIRYTYSNGRNRITLIKNLEP
ncbi:MAG: ATP-binding protein [Bacteroidota bacterium]